MCYQSANLQACQPHRLLNVQAIPLEARTAEMGRGNTNAHPAFDRAPRQKHREPFCNLWIQWPLRKGLVDTGYCLSATLIHTSGTVPLALAIAMMQDAVIKQSSSLAAKLLVVLLTALACSCSHLYCQGCPGSVSFRCRQLLGSM